MPTTGERLAGKIECSRSSIARDETVSSRNSCEPDEVGHETFGETSLLLAWWDRPALRGRYQSRMLRREASRKPFATGPQSSRYPYAYPCSRRRPLAQATAKARNPQSRRDER